jgi:hypothetical protein
MDVLSRIPAAWRPHFIDLGRALAPVDHNPNLFDRALKRWAEREPALHGLRAESVFAEPRACLTEEQARAMIRTARSTDADAELAAWAVIWQFSVALIALARWEQSWPGSDGPRAVVCTAIAELWRLVHHINLDTNKASIFYAMISKARRAVISSTQLTTTIDGQRLSACTTEVLDLLRTPGVDRTADPGYTSVEWDSFTAYLVDLITHDTITEMGWDRAPRRSCVRDARLRALVSYRLAESQIGEHQSITTVATKLGEPSDAMKIIQTALNRTMRCKVDRYSELLTGADPGHV